MTNFLMGKGYCEYLERNFENLVAKYVIYLTTTRAKARKNGYNEV